MGSNFNLWKLIVISISISITTAATASVHYLSPSPESEELTYPPSLLASILSNLGFQDLSTVTANVSLSAATPTTIFAPTDSSLLSCRSCSLALLLQEHSVPGLYPLHFLRTLAFGTKLETVAPNRCLTITISSASAAADAKIFVNGIEINRPGLFNNGLIIIHGIRGFVAHLSPLSCCVERMTSLSFPPSWSTPTFSVIRSMLKDAMLRLRISGYSVLAVAMRAKYTDLSDLRAMTIFALDDESIFGAGGHTYISDLKLHIVPNRVLMATDLINLPVDAVLPTMETGQKLVVTTAGGGGPLAPMRINYVEIKSLDLMYNNRIVVHALSMPFPHAQHWRGDGRYEQIKRPESELMKNPLLSGIIPAPTTAETWGKVTRTVR